MVQRGRGVGQVLLLLCSKTCGNWGGLHGIEILSGIKSLHHGYIAFSTWFTIADINMDIIEIYHTHPTQLPHVFEHNRNNTCPTPLTL